VLACKLSLTEIKDGTASIDDILKINALLDMQADIEAAHYDKQK
jgi:hypothetical protein